jgi:hypothetical protein
MPNNPLSISLSANDVWDVVKFVLSSAFVGSIIAFLLNRRLEAYRTELSRIVSEHDTRFSYLHQRRGDVIDQLYKGIDRIYRTLGASVRAVRLNFDASPEDQRKEGTKFVLLFIDYYYQNRLYLDDGLRQEIEKVIPRLWDILDNFGVASGLTPFAQAGDTNSQAQITGFTNEAANIITSDLLPILQHIEEQMREILGIDVRPIDRGPKLTHRINLLKSRFGLRSFFGKSKAESNWRGPKGS